MKSIWKGDAILKAISILQPRASLIACGAKKIETRGWSTSYRGPIAIHAGKKFDYDAYNKLRYWIKPLEKFGDLTEYPAGAVIAIAD